MAQGLTVTVDTREFDRVFKEYMNYSKRSFTEACNQHAYYIARNATMTTKAADKEVIRATLEGPSRDYPGVPLAAILVNAQLGPGQGLAGSAMKRAMEKYIKRIQSHVNYVRSGWIPAVKILASKVPRKGGGRIPSGVDKMGRNFGGATPAIDSGWSPIAWIWTSITPKKGMNDRLMKVMEEGAINAMKQETESMKQYIIRKQNEIIKKLWS